MKVFLGGTCNESKWREELIPLLKIEYFNPVVDDWDEEAQAREIIEREEADYCLYTITPLMMGVYSIAEVVEDSNKRPEKTILCILETDGVEYEGETIQKIWTESLRRSLRATEKLVRRNGVRVFYTLDQVANYLNKSA